MVIRLFMLMTFLFRLGHCAEYSKDIDSYELNEHALVGDDNLYPYVVTVLKMSTYLSTGALISDDWVLTAADALFLIREAARTLRIRLGSINYKKGGVILPVKYFEIHPKFDDKSPIYDIALIKLPEKVRLTRSIKPIRLLNTPKQPDATHFVVASWPVNFPYSDEDNTIKSMEMIRRRRILSVTRMHPLDKEECIESLNELNIKDYDSMMCLDTGVMSDPCTRDVGAPVVLNGVLWGIVSSWRPLECENDLSEPSFVSVVSSPNISSWLHNVTIRH